MSTYSCVLLFYRITSLLLARRSARSPAFIIHILDLILNHDGLTTHRLCRIVFSCPNLTLTASITRLTG